MEFVKIIPISPFIVTFLLFTVLYLLQTQRQQLQKSVKKLEKKMSLIAQLVYGQKGNVKINILECTESKIFKVILSTDLGEEQFRFKDYNMVEPRLRSEFRHVTEWKKRCNDEGLTNVSSLCVVIPPEKRSRIAKIKKLRKIAQFDSMIESIKGEEEK